MFQLRPRQNVGGKIRGKKKRLCGWEREGEKKTLKKRAKREGGGKKIIGEFSQKKDYEFLQGPRGNKGRKMGPTNGTASAKFGIMKET